jgi:hypothetical protein
LAASSSIDRPQQQQQPQEPLEARGRPHEGMAAAATLCMIESGPRVVGCVRSASARSKQLQLARPSHFLPSSAVTGGDFLRLTLARRLSPSHPPPQAKGRASQPAEPGHLPSPDLDRSSWPWTTASPCPMLLRLTQARAAARARPALATTATAGRAAPCPSPAAPASKCVVSDQAIRCGGWIRYLDRCTRVCRGSVGWGLGRDRRGRRLDPQPFPLPARPFFFSSLV